MDNSNIFDQDVNTLIQIRDDVAQCNKLEQMQKQLKDKEDKMKKAISQEEKSINDEINATIKKREKELESTYDTQLEASRKKVKKAQDQKAKEKSERVGQRVDQETADTRGYIQQIKTEMKTLFKTNHMPTLCASGLYYSLFNPKNFKEILTLLVCFLVCIVGLPCGLYFLCDLVLFKGNAFFEGKHFFAAVFAALLLLVFLALYFLIFNFTKVKHPDVIAQGRELRNQMLAAQKDVQAITKAINKDKDESQYGLGAYDAKINQFQAEMDEIGKQKKEAMKEFEKVTKQTITNEVNGRRLPKLEDMKRQMAEVEEEKNGIDAQVKQASLAISDNYVKYLGKNICKEDTLNDIINIMASEQIDTISEGIAIYKGEAPHRGDEE